MTQTQFESRSKKLLSEFDRKVKRGALEEVRAEFRERGMIYVRRHTVEPYFRRYRSARPGLSVVSG